MIKQFLTATFVAMLSIACGASGSANLSASHAEQLRRENVALRKQQSDLLAQQTLLREQINAHADAGTKMPPANKGTTNLQEAKAAKTDDKPKLIPAVVSDIPRVDGVGIVGFDESLDPCSDNAYERALVTSHRGPLMGFRLLLPRKLVGRCMAVRRSRYWINIRVDNVEMQARYVQDASGPFTRSIPMSYCTSKDGKVRNLPLTPPRRMTRWLMPRGTHTISYDLYEPAPTGECYEYVKTVDVRQTFPFQQDPWGAVQNAPEAYMLP